MDSSTGGYLQPTDISGPLEGQDLNRFLQSWIVGLSSLTGDLVRPQFQSEPPNVPDFGTAWIAFRYTIRPSDTFPWIGHGVGFSQLQRHESIHLLLSAYDDGTNGKADATIALFRDNSAIPQNLEMLLLNNMGLVSCGEPIAIPSLLKQRWLYRVDLPVVIRREIIRTYPILDVASLSETLVSN
jgi:hypothetical protein